MSNQRLNLSDGNRDLPFTDPLCNEKKYKSGFNITDTAPHRLKRSRTSVSSLSSNISLNSASSAPNPALSLHTTDVKVDSPSTNSSPQTIPRHGRPTNNRTIEKTKVINIHLLRCVALSQSNLHLEALSEAEIALSLAMTDNIFYMICKSQMHRGICLKELGKWKEASWAFTRAANVRGWAVKVSEMKEICELRLAEERLQARKVLQRDN